MQRAKKIVVYLMALWLLCFLYSAVMNYWENGDDFKRDPKVLYEIYGELPIPDNTNEIEKKRIHKREILRVIGYILLYKIIKGTNQTVLYYVLNR